MECSGGGVGGGHKPWRIGGPLQKLPANGGSRDRGNGQGWQG